MAAVNGDGLSIPIKCLIEVVDRDVVDVKETVNFAIVPRHSLFKDIVKTVLNKLGYGPQEISNARGKPMRWKAMESDGKRRKAQIGSVQFKNWKPLDMESLSVRPESTVEDMLADVSAVATLRIRIVSRELEEDLKNKMLLLMVSKSPDVLAKSSCPLSKVQIEQMIDGKSEMSREIALQFYSWYQALQDSSYEVTSTSQIHASKETVTGLLRVPAPLRTPRARISFDHNEVSKLQHWFEQNSHPSKVQMTMYLAELNAQPCRQEKNLDLPNIMYWFKNARAAVRRQGRSDASLDLSEDEDRQSDKEDSSAPHLPNKNAVYMINNPIIEDGHQSASDESDMDELSVTDDEDVPRVYPDMKTADESIPMDHSDPAIKQESVVDVNTSRAQQTPSISSSTSSPQNPLVPANMFNMANRFPNYNLYGALPVAAQAYLLQNNPFYKEWNEKLVAQAHAANNQSSLVKGEPKLSPNDAESKADRQKRHRAFIDPVSEIPKLEQWFLKDTHPSHYVIDQICDELNRGEFRMRYPKLSAKNIQLWFKNHRAKVKRSRVGGGADLNSPMGGNFAFA